MMLTVEATSNKLLRFTRGPGAVIVLNALQRRAGSLAGVDEQRVHVIPHFVEVSTLVRQERLRQVLFVGRLVPGRGWPSCLGSALAGVHCLSSGTAAMPRLSSGSRRTRVATYHSSASRTGRRFNVPCRESAVLAVPSLWHEVAHSVILEAIELGLPVVGSDVGGIPDLIGAGRGVLTAGRPGGVGERHPSLIDDLPYAERLAAEAWAYADGTGRGSDGWTRSGQCLLVCRRSSAPLEENAEAGYSRV